VALTPERILRLLSQGEIEVEGLIPWSSNATLLVTVQDGELSTLAVYKPQQGERPLWDFEHGSLGKREVAAYVVSDALGWDLIPPTILREGPYGPGSVQFFIHAQEDAHYFTIRHEACYEPELMRLAAFDVLTNNADRKSGHCLLDQRGGLWAIDNALTFHTEPKLRTVIWDFAERFLPEEVVGGLEALGAALVEGTPLSRALAGLLREQEVAALRDRLQQLVQAQRFPVPGPGRPVPWPPV
jgi:uncharacterized repeat protein (TIGR03843 family)